MICYSFRVAKFVPNSPFHSNSKEEVEVQNDCLSSDPWGDSHAIEISRKYDNNNTHKPILRKLYRIFGQCEKFIEWPL